MVFKTIKKASSLTGLVISLLIIIGIFIGGFNYYASVAENAGVSIDPTHNESAQMLSAAQANLSENIDAIETNLQSVSEADSTWEVAWNGLKGLGNTLKLPLNFVVRSRDIWSALKLSLTGVPNWIILLLEIGTAAFIVFLVVSLLKGEPRM